MLMTMEEACKNAWEVFPNPERIDKVEISMENLEKVVRERNEAYWQLETGYHGEVPTKFQNNVLGWLYYHQKKFFDTQIILIYRFESVLQTQSTCYS